MLRLAMAVMCLLALLTASPASASTRNKIIKDCADDGVLQGKYSPSALRDARQNLPSDVAEYTDCADVLRRAESPSSGGGAGATGGGYASPGAAGAAAAAGADGGPVQTAQTPQDEDTLAKASVAGKQPVSINEQPVVPGTAGLRAGAPRNGIPGTLVIALVLLAFAGGTLAIPAVRRGIPALKATPLVPSRWRT
jgi:hypothetical protein